MIHFIVLITRDMSLTDSLNQGEHSNAQNQIKLCFIKYVNKIFKIPVQYVKYR